MRVAQILFALPDDPAGQAEVRQRAEAVREEIAAGKISFADAARKYSSHPAGRRWRAARGSRGTSRCRRFSRRLPIGCSWARSVRRWSVPWVCT